MARLGVSLFSVCPDPLQGCTRFPQQQEAAWIAVIEGIKQVANLSVGPDEWPLKFGETDGTAADFVDQRSQRIGGCAIEHRYI